MQQLNSKCECQTYESARAIEAHLAVSAELLVGADATDNVKKLRKKLAALQKAVDEVLKGAEQHEKNRVEFMQNVVQHMKLERINAGESLRTVSWETREK